MILDDIDFQIINILLANEQPITSNQIAFQLDLSSRTIRNRISKMKNITSQFGITIETKPKIGIQLKIVDESTFSKFINEWKYTSDLDRIIQLLISSDYILSEKIKDTLFISKTQLTLYLNELRRILKKYHLTLESKPHYGLKICGEEINIRRFMASYYVQSPVTNQKNIYDSDKFKKLCKYLEETLSKYNYFIPFERLINLCKHLLVLIERVGDNYSISSGICLDTKDYPQEYEIAMEIIEYLSTTYHIDIPISEHIYIMMHLSGKEFLKDHQQRRVSQEVNILVDTILNSIFEDKKIDLTNDLDLRLMLALHIVPLLERIRFELELKNPLLKEIQKQCIAGHDLAIIAVSKINDQYNTKLSEHEMSYFSMHFEVALLKRQDSIERHKILIICSSGRVSSQMLKIKFEQLFSKYIDDVIVTELDTLDKILSENTFDFIFSAIPIPDNISISSPIFEFSFFLDQASINKIKSTLDHTKDLVDIIDKNLFFVEKEVDSVENCLSYLVKETEKCTSLPVNFIDFVLERERIVSTDILPKVALPHPSKIVTDTTFIAFLILEEPIWWNHQYVYLVCLISISKEDSYTFKSVMDQLAEVLSNQKKLQYILEKRNYEAIEEMVYSE